MTLWSAGRYEAVGERIAGIAARLVAIADRRRPFAGADVLDVACGSGNAALAAAAAGAHVTGVDVTPELIAIGAQKARDAGLDIAWVTADAADTGLPAQSFDAAVSNMGLIFVDPERQLTELIRVLKPGAVLAFSSWVRMGTNPLFDPIIATLGPPPPAPFTPDQWGDPQIAAARLQAGFRDIATEDGECAWEFPSLDAAVHFVCHESPMHADLMGRVGDAQRPALVTAFETALRVHETSTGTVAFTAPYVVVSALAR